MRFSFKAISKASVKDIVKHLLSDKAAGRAILLENVILLFITLLTVLMKQKQQQQTPGHFKIIKNRARSQKKDPKDKKL